MNSSCRLPEPTIDELYKQLEKSKQELEDLLQELRKQPGRTIIVTNTQITKITPSSVVTTRFSTHDDLGTIARVSFFCSLSLLCGIYVLQAKGKEKPRSSVMERKHIDMRWLHLCKYYFDFWIVDNIYTC
jgi:hypothetical protein